jgi:phage tail sheath protein FI
MTTMAAPGVYTNIRSSGNKPMEAAGTSIAGFIGQSAKGAVNKAVFVASWAQYEKEFGSFADSKYLSHAVYGFFANGGGGCYICNIGAEVEGESSESLTAKLMGEDRGPGARTGINTFNDREDIGIVLAPGFTNPEAHAVIVNHCETLDDRFAILDCPEELHAGLDTMYRPRASTNAAYYFPWVKAFDPVKKQNVYQPPSGFVAGIFSRVDHERGVHKAPANECVRATTGLKYSLTRAEQALLNPRGINLIRDFGDSGIKVYGARTLTDDPEWRYLNVRRLFLNVKQTIQKGTEWAVFEPNNEQLWGNLKRNIAAYLKTLFNEGMLAGTTPDEAFYVVCDKSNNPQESIDQGIVRVDIGIAPVKPAEFINIQIQQHYDDDQA